MKGISIHAPLAGRDSCRGRRSKAAELFQSTRPLRGATDTLEAYGCHERHFNPRAPCGARHKRDVIRSIRPKISIHAPLAGRDLFGYADYSTPIIFQSTRPLRGATPTPSKRRRLVGHFNPRAPCGARPCSLSHASHALVISIHAPLAGRDKKNNWLTLCQLVFQSTRPLRGATCEERLSSNALEGFQSTRPLRGATLVRDAMAMFNGISIHAPLAGRDGFQI